MSDENWDLMYGSGAEEQDPNPVQTAGFDPADLDSYAQYQALQTYSRPEEQADGSILYKQPDGSYLDLYGNKVTAEGRYAEGSGNTSTFKPTAAQDTTITSWLSGLPNEVKSYFTKKDASGKDVTDWTKILQSGLGIASLTGLNASTRKPSGYQGGVPVLNAYRQQVANTYDPNRRPGSGGRRYFSDVIYAPEAQGATASSLTQAQADALARKNAANPAEQARSAPVQKPAEEIAKSNVFNATPTAQTQSAVLPSVPKNDVNSLLASVSQREPAYKEGDYSIANYMRSPAYKDFLKTLPEMQTDDMQMSRYGFSPGSGSMVKPRDDAYEQWAGKNLPVAGKFAEGGIAQGRYLRGETDGMEDKIPATIDKDQPARLSHGEFVIPADVVSHLGNGNSDAGAKHLYKMMDRIRQARTGTKKQGKQINAEKFMPKYAKGGIASFAVGGVTAPAGTSGQDQSLATYAGPGIADYLSRGQALSKEGYQAYTGPLTAGPSDLQTKAFTNAGNLNIPTGQMGAFTPSTFGAEQANAYMNPYLQAALDPVLKEQRRQAEINNLTGMGSLTKAGAFGGGRQAVMESEGLRNLLDLQTKTLGEGYRTAYDKAADQFNKEQGLGLQAQTAANQYGLQALTEQAGLGAQQRGITSEGVAADRAQFEEEKLDPYKKVEFAQKLYSNLPITAASYDVPQQNNLQQLLAALAIAMPDTFGKSTATK